MMARFWYGLAVALVCLFGVALGLLYFRAVSYQSMQEVQYDGGFHR